MRIRTRVTSGVPDPVSVGACRSGTSEQQVKRASHISDPVPDSACDGRKRMHDMHKALPAVYIVCPQLTSTRKLPVCLS
jgi:hypothetical protein